MKLILKNLDELRDFAKEMADKVLNNKSHKKAVVLALEGDLGAGKTAFAQALAKELGVKERILSPTFLIMRKYQIPKFKIQINSKAQTLKNKLDNFYHLDVYRLKDKEELLMLGFKEILKDSQNIVLIEWADKVKKIIPKDAMWFKFSHGAKESERIVES